MSPPLWLLAAYLVGAVPASYLAGRMRGIDLRQHGSKNLGATNVYRLLGWGYAVPVGLFDVGKGAAAVALLGRLAQGPDWLPVALGAAAVVGHVFSPFVGFRGGKGVATAAGMFLALAPQAVLIAVPVWGLCLWFSGYVSLSSIVAAATFPLWVRLTEPGAVPTLVASVAFLEAIPGRTTPAAQAGCDPAILQVKNRRRDVVHRQGAGDGRDRRRDAVGRADPRREACRGVPAIAHAQGLELRGGDCGGQARDARFDAGLGEDAVAVEVPLGRQRVAVGIAARAVERDAAPFGNVIRPARAHRRTAEAPRAKLSGGGLLF